MGGIACIMYQLTESEQPELRREDVTVLGISQLVFAFFMILWILVIFKPSISIIWFLLRGKIILLSLGISFQSAKIIHLPE